MRLVTDMVEFGAQELPLWHPVSISGYHIREAGATAAQELAFTLADGFAYVEAALARGLESTTSRRASPSSSTPPRLLRGDREVPGRAPDLGAGAARPLRRKRALAAHALPHADGRVSLTAQQPEVNIVRTALQALAAVFGGTQSLHANSFDETLALPTEDAVRIALRTQQIIAHESGAVNTIDPLGGSCFVENLTDVLEAQASEYFDGSTRSAAWSRRSSRASSSARSPRRDRYQYEVESGKARDRRREPHVLEDEEPIAILKIDPALEQKQIDRLAGVKASRDSAKVEAGLAALKDGAAKDGVNLMPLIVDASRDYVTLGEMCDALREVWGVWRETPVF